MMKKLIGLLLLVALLATAAFAVSVSADETNHTATYTDTAPTIDGTIDEVWAKTTAIPFISVANTSYSKILWTNEGLYVLAYLDPTEVKDKGFSGIRLVVTEARATSYWTDDVGYLTLIKEDGVTEGTWFCPGRADGGSQAIVKGADGSLTIEVYAPHKSTKENTVFDNSHEIGFTVEALGKDGSKTYASRGTIWSYKNDSNNGLQLAIVTLIGAPCKSHDYVAATCKTPRTCKHCGIVDPDDDALDPTNHKGEQKCKDAGEKHETYWDCCNAIVETTDHEWSGTTTVKREATCTLTKQVIDTCTKCGAEKVVEETPALGHEQGEWTTMTAATCTKEGFEYITCQRCWETIDSRLIAKLAHTPGEWIVDQEAAVGIAGSRHRNCTVCAAKLDTEEIEALPEPKKSGCKGSVSASFCLIPAAMAVAVVARRRKKEQ